MEFKQLDIKPEGNKVHQVLRSAHFKKTLLFIAIGAVAGVGYFYLSIGHKLDEIAVREILKSMAIGGFFGFFLTNSPCARGRC